MYPVNPRISSDENVSEMPTGHGKSGKKSV
jgi:hypothetical protein